MAPASPRLARDLAARACQVQRLGALVIDAKATREIIRERVRAVQAAGMDPDASRAASPGALDASTEQITAQAAADEPREQAEVRDLDVRIGLRLQLDVAGRRAAHPQHPRFELRPLQIVQPVRKGPAQAIDPVPLAADCRVQETIQLGRRNLGAHHARAWIGRRLGASELSGAQHFQVPGRDLDLSHASCCARRATCSRAVGVKPRRIASLRVLRRVLGAGRGRNDACDAGIGEQPFE